MNSEKMTNEFTISEGEYAMILLQTPLSIPTDNDEYEDADVQPVHANAAE